VWFSVLSRRMALCRTETELLTRPPTLILFISLASLTWLNLVRIWPFAYDEWRFSRNCKGVQILWRLSLTLMLRTRTTRMYKHSWKPLYANLIITLPFSVHCILLDVAVLGFLWELAYAFSSKMGRKNVWECTSRQFPRIRFCIGTIAVKYSQEQVYNTTR